VTISESWCCESLVMSETSEPKDTAPPLLKTPCVAVTVFPRRLCQARALRRLRWSMLEGFDLHGCCFSNVSRLSLG
jgi:hypothetical protein